MSRLRKIGWERWLTKRAFKKQVEEMKKRLHPEELHEKLRDIDSDEHYELSMLSEEEASIKSDKIIALARLLDVPIPQRQDEHGVQSPDWQEGSIMYRFALSEGGRSRLREDIRKEKKARHEQRVRWLAWLTPAIAAAGIVATILTRK
ncbi:Uncharacterised protein [Janthinobacterium lividum]|nr:hypothetical protein JANLI_30220 [Janthinobacterium lividum]STQ95619.1 Uncharacterised protein [Janthinobacterium lividum]